MLDCAQGSQLQHLQHPRAHAPDSSCQAKHYGSRPSSAQSIRNAPTRPDDYQYSLFDATHFSFLDVQHIAAKVPHLLMHSQERTSDAIGRNSRHPHCCNRERVLGATILCQPNSCAACCCRHHDLHSQHSSRSAHNALHPQAHTPHLSNMTTLSCRGQETDRHTYRQPACFLRSCSHTVPQHCAPELRLL